MNTTFKKNLLTSITIGFSLSTAIAAQIPEGTRLAEKQELIWNVGANPATLDPQKIEGTVESDYAHQLFETLVVSNEEGKILPGVAKSWEHSADFKTWTFHLRDNARWSNGDPVVAQDFVYAWKRLVDPKTASPYASYLHYLKVNNVDDIIAGKKSPDELGVKAIDDHTLVIHLYESIPYVDKLVEHAVLAPTHKATIEKYGDAWTKPGNLVGNGAFRLVSLVVNENAILERNEYYWDNEHTALDKITLLTIESGSTDVARYRAGNSDMTGSEIPTELFDKIKAELGDELYINPKLCTYLYEFNNSRPPFNNQKVRQALKMALDRNIITTKVLKEGQKPAYSFAPPSITGADKTVQPEWFKWDRKKRHLEAVQLLEEAGYSKNKPLEFTLLYNTTEGHKKLAIAASSIWKKNLGGLVNVKLENQEWKTYLDTRHQGNYDMARAGWCADYNEASTFMNYFLSNSSNNTSFYKSETYDNAIAQTYMAETDEQRAEFYAKAEAILDKDSPVVPVYYYVGARLIKPYVKGFAAAHPNNSYYLKDVYIIKH